MSNPSKRRAKVYPDSRRGTWYVQLYWGGKRYWRGHYDDETPLMDEKSKAEKVADAINEDIKRSATFYPEMWFKIPRSKRAIIESRNHPAWQIWFLIYQKNAKIKSIPFEIELDRFIAICSRPCLYCGELPRTRRLSKKLSDLRANGVDRMDNSSGYTIENSVPCCSWCNYAKNSGTKEDFIRHCFQVAQFLRKSVCPPADHRKISNDAAIG